MITVKYNIDFKKALKELEKEKLSDTLNEGVADKFAKNSAKFIKQGKVIPRLKQLTIDVKRKEGSSTPKTPLMMTGKLVNSLKGNSKGISGVSYGKDHLKEGGYKFKGLPVPQRKFITADLPTEKSANNKIYKEFEKKFVKLLSKSIRKR